MTEQRLLRLSCLRYCVSARTIGLRTPLLLLALRQGGFTQLTPAALRRALRQAERHGLLRRKPELVRGGTEIWQATHAGRKLLGGPIA